VLSPEGSSAPPELPRFRRDMEKALLTAARAGSRRRPTLTRGRVAAGIAVAVVAIAAGAGLDAALNGRHSTAPRHSLGRSVHIQEAAFSVDTGPGGVVTVTLLQDFQRIDPEALRAALARAGVPALVTSGRVCYVPGPTDLTQVLGPPQHRPGGTRVITIYPAAIPAGSELSIGYFRVLLGGGIYVNLVPRHGHLTCSSTPPARHGPAGG
jgi:hypothetical protein